VGIKICVPIPAADFNTLPKMISEAEEEEADLIEIRLDYMGREIINQLSSLRNIVSRCSTPLIATNRHSSQGGKCSLSEGERIETLIKAAEAGFEYVDIELCAADIRRVVDRIRAHGAKIVVSHHDFSHTPQISDLERIVSEQSGAGADICKVVTMANDVMDSIRTLVFTYEMSRKVDLVCFAMGEKGLLSRILSPVFGAAFTYASLSRGLETAPGQITINEMREIYRRMKLDNEGGR
jgi:3-dehydroquinate dehydratase-1